MCGVAGLSKADGDTFDVVKLARELILGIEHRGRDASGVGWTDAEGTWYDRQPVTASKYVGRMPLNPLATTVILHTRMATGGTAARPEINENNHPFPMPGVLGIHNGILWNDAELWETAGVKPTCATDSAALFAALAHRGDTRRTDVLRKVKGDAALAWIECDLPDRLFLARLESRPLVLMETEGGSVLFASTEAVIRQAARKCDVKLRPKAIHIPEWTYLVVRRGNFAQWVNMPKPVRPKATTSKWATYRNSLSAADEAWWAKVLDDEDDAWPEDRVNPALRLGYDAAGNYSAERAQREAHEATTLTAERHARKAAARGGSGQPNQNRRLTVVKGDK